MHQPPLGSQLSEPGTLPRVPTFSTGGLSLSLFLSVSLSLFLSFSLSLFFSLSLSLSLFLSFSQPRTHIISLTFYLTHSLSFSFSHTHVHTLSHTYISLSHSHTHTISITFSHTHTHTHTHTLPAGIPHLDSHQAPVVSITPISADEGGGARTGALLDHPEEEAVGLSFQLASLDRWGRGRG